MTPNPTDTVAAYVASTRKLTHAVPQATTRTKGPARSDRLDRTAARLLLDLALQTLDSRPRDVFRLVHLQGATVPEVAALLRVRPATVVRDLATATREVTALLAPSPDRPGA